MLLTIPLNIKSTSLYDTWPPNWWSHLEATSGDAMMILVYFLYGLMPCSFGTTMQSLNSKRSFWRLSSPQCCQCDFRSPLTACFSGHFSLHHAIIWLHVASLCWASQSQLYYVPHKMDLEGSIFLCENPVFMSIWVVVIPLVSPWPKQT